MAFRLRRDWTRRSLLGLFCAGIAFIVVLLIVVAPWMNVSRFRRNITQSISGGVGRPVRIGSVAFQILPQPAFVLSNFSVAEDPAFGAEPVLTSDSVTATLRLSSLLRGRVQIATLSLDAPSLNLTRNSAGQWDFDSLLQRTSQQRSAHPEPFPYVEASSARINFKYGAEKQPFSLMDADLALWKESGGKWHMRVKAQPVRTDLDLTDTGVLRMEAVLGNAPELGRASVLAHVDWRQVPLGAVDRLVRGNDTGWRGTVNVSADVSGALTSLDILMHAHAEDFHRAEVVPGDALSDDLQCSAHYERAQSQISAIACQSPLGQGEMQLHGDISLRAQPAGTASSDLHAEIQHVPAAFVLRALRHVRAGIPSQIAATGELNGHVDCGGTPGTSASPCSGVFHATDWSLLLPGAARPRVLPTFDLTSAAHPTSRRKPSVLGWLKAKLKSKGSMSAVAMTAQGATSKWILSPVSIALGAAAPASISGSLDRAGYNLAITGPATLDCLMSISRSFQNTAFPVHVQSATGNAQLALTMQGHWLPQAGSVDGTSKTGWGGTVQLRPSVIALESWPGKIQLSSATLHLAPGGILWDNIHGIYQKEPFDGSLQYVTATATNTDVGARNFYLHMQNLNPGQLERSILQSNSRSSLLQDLVSRWTSQNPALPKFTGQIQVDTLTVGTLQIRHATLGLQLDGQKATATHITGDVLGGKLTGTGSVAWATGIPLYQGVFDLRGMQPDALPTLFSSATVDTPAAGWGHGTADFHLEIATQGMIAPELAQHTVARFTSRWKDGAWSAPALTKTPLAAFSQLRMQGQVQNQIVQIQQGELTSTAGRENVTGTVTFQGQVNLLLVPHDIHVTGTLLHPELAGVASPAGSTAATP